MLKTDEAESGSLSVEHYRFQSLCWDPCSIIVTNERQSQ
jgi:hypothetical protein